MADDNTNLINVFNKKNLEKIFERDGMVTIKTNLYFNNQYMDEEQMKIYVGALTDSLENLTEFNSINNIFILWRNVDREYNPVYEEDIKIKRNLKAIIVILLVSTIFVSYNVFFRGNEALALSKYGSRGE